MFREGIYMSSDMLREILEKCEIYYYDELISKERILQKYLEFFDELFSSDDRKISFSLHTGSVCFDVIAVIATTLGCLSFNLSTNDDIISSLNIDDMVMFKNQRYKWLGIEKMYGEKYMILKQDGKGRNGDSKRYLPYSSNKHLIKPYFGNSHVTDGRGVRKNKSDREDFLSYVFDISKSEVPSTVGVSAVIVSEKEKVIEIIKNLKICYGEGKFIELLDIVSASYFTSNGEEQQLGKNPTKSEPALKVAGHYSQARSLVLNKQSNRVIIMLSIKNISNTDNSTELDDLLRRKTLKFAMVSSPLNNNFIKYVVEKYQEAEVFACTKEYLSENFENESNSSGCITENLHRQIQNTINKKINTSIIENDMSWETFCKIKDILWKIKQSEWNNEYKEEFIKTAYSLLNLFSTAVFSMENIEKVICKQKLNMIASPSEKIKRLYDISNKIGIMNVQCLNIAEMLDLQYKFMYAVSPKGKALREFIKMHTGEKIAIIVPKAYYATILNYIYGYDLKNKKIYCTTVSRFDSNVMYDHIITVGDICGKNFDALQCNSAQRIEVLLYDYEKKMFYHRKNCNKDLMRKLNYRSSKEKRNTDIIASLNETEAVAEEIVQKFSDLDEYIDSISSVDINRVLSKISYSGANVTTADVRYVGGFSSGEYILFSKYYSAVVYNQKNGTIEEKTADKLHIGDLLVFTKKDDYTKNIVDLIFGKLIETNRFDNTTKIAWEKSKYWKNVLRDYKETNGYKYRSIVKRFQGFGKSFTESTIRQWIVPESHIVGPRNESTLKLIGEITGDNLLKNNAHEYYEACDIVRHQRRNILKLIEKAINDNLRGVRPEKGNELEVVYENVEKLSEIYELENISEIENGQKVNINLINRPISELEVLI